MKGNKEQVSELFGTAMKIRNLMLKFRPTESVSSGEMHMLKAIERCANMNAAKKEMHPGVSSSELSNHLNASKPSTSRMLTSLEEKGYLRRVSEKRDRRVVYIHLTPEGENVLREAARKMEILMDALGEKMDSDELEQFVKSFHKLYEIMDETLQ